MRINKDDQAWIKAALDIAGIICFTVSAIGVNALNSFQFFGLIFAGSLLFLISSVFFRDQDKVSQLALITIFACVVAYSSHKLIYGLTIVLGIN